MKSITFTLSFLLLCSLMAANLACVQKSKTCALDYDLSSIKNVTVDDRAKFVTNEIEIVVNRPIGKVYKWWFDTPLEAKVDTVRSTRNLTDKKHGEIGSRRIICNFNGSTAIEEVINNVPEKYFSYKVWDFSHEFLAQRVNYAKGEFWFTPMENKTHIKWRYSFKLSNEKYRNQFESSFMDLFWIGWMTKTINNIKSLAEKDI